MITELHIENVAVIARADIAFGAGLNVLTGETGAGKSIVVDSIGAVLGARVSRELVRAGSDHALIRAVFTDAPALWFAENEIEAGDELILQRRIGADGKSTCRVNGVPVSAAQLQSLGALLLDIHGQNDGRRLLDERRHLDALDRFMEAPELLTAYAAEYDKFIAIRHEIERLTLDEREKARRIERLTEQIEELEHAAVRPGEEAEIAAQCSLMQHAGKLTAQLEEAYAALYAAGENAIDLAASAEQQLRAAAALAPELSDAAKSVGEAQFLLTDAAERIRELRERLDFSEEAFDQLEARLSLLRRLQRKYACDEAGLAALLPASRTELAELSAADDLLAQLHKDLERQRAAVLRAGKALGAARAAAAQSLSARVETQLRELNMPAARFAVELTPVANADGFHAAGCENACFLMSANAGAPLGKLNHIASGGELSRIMLALKSVFSETDSVESMVFDEIDTGVSGVAAQRVGEKLGRLGRARQLLCITHLPQIAAMADQHFRIEKSESGGATFTRVELLDDAGRARELARLHGGDAVTETTLRSAQEQLEAARAFKARCAKGAAT